MRSKCPFWPLFFVPTNHVTLRSGQHTMKCAPWMITGVNFDTPRFHSLLFVFCAPVCLRDTLTSQSSEQSRTIAVGCKKHCNANRWASMSDSHLHKQEFGDVIASGYDSISFFFCQHSRGQTGSSRNQHTVIEKERASTESAHTGCVGFEV